MTLQGGQTPPCSYVRSNADAAPDGLKITPPDVIYFGYSSAVCCDLRSAGGQRVYTALGAALSVPGVVYLLALPLVGVMRT